jgi:hypothetical protein
MIAALLFAMMAAEPPIVITHVNVVTRDLESTVFMDASVEIAGGKITRSCGTALPHQALPRSIAKGRWFAPAELVARERAMLRH